MALRHKKFAASFLLFISLIGIGWFFFYEYSIKRLENSLNQIEINLKQKGYKLSYSKVGISGSPFLLKVEIQDPYFQDPAGFIEWKGSAIEIQAKPWKINSLEFSLIGEHGVSLSRIAELPSRILHINGAKGLLTVSSQFIPTDLDLTVEKITSIMDSKPQPISLRKMSINFNNFQDLSHLTVYFSTEFRNLEAILDLQPLDHPLEINFVASFSGYKPKNFPKSLTEWRDGGGVIDIPELKISWLPLIIEAEGTLTLDKELYPLGSFSSKIVAYEDAIEDMVKLGWIKKKNAKAVLFMLNLLSVPDEAYGRRLTVPITLQNHRLSVGPAPLLKLLPLQDFKEK